MAKVSRIRTHQRDLENVFLFSSISIPIQNADRYLRGAVDSCLAFIKSKVRTPEPVIGYFLRNRDWEHSQEVKSLFAAYVKAGYIQVNEPISSGSLPLESAITKSNLVAYSTLIINGADITKVPSNAIGYIFPNDSEDPKDIFSYIGVYQAGVVAQAFVAATKEAIMRRQIELTPRESDISTIPQQSPRRRMGSI